MLFFRSAYNFIVPSIYAEDGMWISSIIQKGFFYTLFHAEPDYLVTGDILLEEAAYLLNTGLFGMNLRYLAVCVAAIQYIFFSLCALLPVICFKNDIKGWMRGLIWMLILLMPVGQSGYEIFGKISNSGYMFYFIAFCLVYARIFYGQRFNKPCLVLLDFILLVCCTTNAVSYVLVGSGFVIDFLLTYKNALRQKPITAQIKLFFSQFKNKMWIVLGILCICFAYYETFCLNVAEIVEASSAQNTIEFFARAVLFYVIYPIYQHMNDVIVIALFMILLLLIVFLLRFGKQKTMENAKLLFCIGATLLITLSTFVARHSLLDQLNRYTTSWIDRYYYVINLCTMLTMIMMANQFWKKKRTGKIISLLIVLSLVVPPVTNLSYLFQFDDPQTNSAHVDSFYERLCSAVIDEDRQSYIVRTDFSWFMTVPDRYLAASLANTRDGTLRTVNITDVNWTHGVMQGENSTLLFDSSLLPILKECGTLSAGGKTVRVVSVTDDGNANAMVVCDTNDLQAFAYPNAITFQIRDA